MHSHRAIQNDSRISAAITKWSRDNAWQRCLAMEGGCSGNVIKAHSIQKALIRNYLARNGEIYMFKDEGQSHQLLPVGYNKATCFTGFCEKHDSELFREIDFNNTRLFDPKSNRQIILLSLRAVAREYWAKLNAQKLYRRINELINRQDYTTLANMLNLQKIDPDQFTRVDGIKGFLLGTDTSLKRLQKLYKSLYHQMQTRKYHLTKISLFHLPGSTNVSVASVFAPDFDLVGNQLNTFYIESDVTDVVLTVLPTVDGTWVVFTYHKRHIETLSPFFSQLESLDCSTFKNVISKMIIMHCENVVLAPTFVEKLPEKSRSLIEKVFRDTLCFTVPYDHVPDMSLFQ